MSLFPELAKWEVPFMKAEEHPSALDIVKRNNISLLNKTALVTGGSAGIGVETVRALSAAGARVFVLARNKEKTTSVLDKISAEFPQNGGLEIVQGELDSLASVNAAANDLLKRTNQLNILIANASTFQVPFALTRDGFESQLAVNHLAHHLLFKKLADLMVKSSTPEFHSRVVVVSSAVHLWAELDFNDIHFTQGREYTPGGAHLQSKLANIYFANHIEKLYGAKGLHAMSLHPGGIRIEYVVAKTHEEQVKMGIFTPDGDYAFPFKWKSPEQGAATSIYGAVSPDLEGKGGLYLEDAAVASQNAPGTLAGYSPAILDEATAAKLWDWTESAVSKFAKA